LVSRQCFFLLFSIVFHISWIYDDAYDHSKIFATSARVWTRNTSLSSFQRSNWSPTYILHFIKWRLTPSYAAKDTIFWQKRPKTIVIRIIVLDDNIQIYSYGLLCEPVLSISKKSYFIYKSTYKKFCILKAAGEIYWKHEQEWDNLEFNFFVNN
jgi:hypothetical protein